MVNSVLIAVCGFVKRSGVVAALLLAQPGFAQQIDIPGPPGSGAFGTHLVALPNGNFVVADPGFDSAQHLDIGAVYLYDQDATLISTLKGSTQNNQVGSGGVFVLANGNFVVCSPSWDDPGAANVGAATWVSGETGLTAEVSSANSLVGTTMDDQVCSHPGVFPLDNGNYVVSSSAWDFAVTPGVGASTWGNGTTGVTGVVSPTNSLVGSTAFDFVGAGVIELSNGNYVVNSELWDHGANANAGAVTWANGTTGVFGVVSTTNSLVGSARQAFDAVTSVVPLVNGNYVVTDHEWDNGANLDAGAACWSNGTTGLAGLMSPAICVTGNEAFDHVGIGAATALSNGHYVVNSWFWRSMGAATWANGTTGLVGLVSVANSLVGSANDQVGSGGIVALSNGNYVVGSHQWKNQSAVAVGATTWANGETGLTGLVTSGNSMVASSNLDSTPMFIVPLANGNYVVRRPSWNNPGITVDVGAVTWANGSFETSGVVSAANSLIGVRVGDGVSNYGVTALSNGNYVVQSADWSLDAVKTAVGAATWANGQTGLVGQVSAANSLVGGTASDHVGRFIIALGNGDYVVLSPDWDNNLVFDTGAATWADGAEGRSGPVTTGNSFIGTKPGDKAGSGNGFAVTAGFYVVRSPLFDFGAAANSGVVSIGRELVGLISMVNSIHGYANEGGATITVTFNAVSNQLIVGQPLSNIISLLAIEIPDPIFDDGFELNP